MDFPAFLHEEVIILQGDAGAGPGAGKAVSFRTQGETDKTDFVERQVKEWTPTLLVLRGQVETGLRVVAQGGERADLVPVRRPNP